MARWSVGSRAPRVWMAASVASATWVAACEPGAPGGASEELGVVHLAASCNAAVADQLDRGVALLHHMTYPGALASFEEVARGDPECALAYWGAAMTYFQPLWPNRPSPSDLGRGWELAQEARQWVEGDDREDHFVATAEAFFDPEGVPDYWARIQSWAAATESLYRAYPRDRESRALYALSLLATASRADDPAVHNAQAAEVLAGILAEEPRHPGAVHYTIHANDFVGREHESLDVVRSYGAIAPDNAHALHMPTHIFVRLGSWDEVIDWNRRAAAAALRQPAGPSGEYVWDEFPHAAEYLVYAYLQKGDDESARELIDSLHATDRLQPSFKTAFHFASTEARYALERGDWAAAVALVPRTPATLDWEAFPWPEAVVWFARGLGGAHTGDAAVVAESLDRLTSLRGRAEEMGEALFAAQIEILRLEVGAWQAWADGNASDALAAMGEAASLEERTPKHPVTPAPTLPASELLGEMHLALGDAASARDAFRISDERTPGRFDTLLGLARASAALGDGESARRYYRAVVDAAVPGSERPGVEEANEYLDSDAGSG